MPPGLPIEQSPDAERQAVRGVSVADPLPRAGATIHAVVLLAVGLLKWVGSALLLDAWGRRVRHPSLEERLAPYQIHRIGEEAQRWLDQGK
ncbi:MAG: hypothetical protein ACYDH5_10500 [Acidimicrobiales bacterium]